MRAGELLRIRALGEGRQVNRESKLIGRLFQPLHSEQVCVISDGISMVLVKRLTDRIIGRVE